MPRSRGSRFGSAAWRGCPEERVAGPRAIHGNMIREEKAHRTHVGTRRIPLGAARRGSAETAVGPAPYNMQRS